MPTDACVYRLVHKVSKVHGRIRLSVLTSLTCCQALGLRSGLMQTVVVGLTGRGQYKQVSITDEYLNNEKSAKRDARETVPMTNYSNWSYRVY